MYFSIKITLLSLWVLTVQMRATHASLLYDCSYNASFHLPCQSPHDKNPIPTLKWIDATKRRRLRLIVVSKKINFFQDHYNDQASLELSENISLNPQYIPSLHTIWSFNGDYPGPVIYTHLDTQIEISVTNRLAHPISFGFREMLLPQEKIGTKMIYPKQTQKWNVFLRQLGTFMYHCSHVTHSHPASALLNGVIIVEKPQTFTGEHHIIQINKDIRLDSKLSMLELQSQSVEENILSNFQGRDGNIVLINGRSISAGYAVDVDDKTLYRFHFINTGRFSTLDIKLPVPFRIVHQWTHSNIRDQLNKQSLRIPPGTAAVIEVNFRGFDKNSQPYITFSNGINLNESIVIRKRSFKFNPDVISQIPVMIRKLSNRESSGVPHEHFTQ